VARVLLFGPLRDIAGWRERDLPDAPATIYGLREFLSREDATLGEALARRGVQIALDQAIIRGDAAIGSASEVAFMSPMSGG
jgi:molybdopterin synthase sulfur carrier subunit